VTFVPIMYDKCHQLKSNQFLQPGDLPFCQNKPKSFNSILQNFS
jgi:hypothetical protein